MANLYLREDLETTTPGGEIRLEGAEARHAVTVARTRVGDELTVGNGRGLLVFGTVTEASGTAVVIGVERIESSPAPTERLVLAQALAKAGRDELAIQTATELGVDAVIPWSAARSVSRWEGAKVARGAERWSAIVREASKQSMRPWLPEVRDLASTARLTQLASSTRMLILEPGAAIPLSDQSAGGSADGRDTVVVVGPEGGIAPHELTALEQAGAQLVRLGGAVLRTSSAGPAALAVLNTQLGRW
jgi:16S rRNA (uracil1498-N3)-methyltransferase